MNTIISARYVSRRASVKRLPGLPVRRLLPLQVEPRAGTHSNCSPEILTERATTITDVLKKILDQTNFFHAGVRFVLLGFLLAVLVGGGITEVPGQESSTNTLWIAPLRAARQENPVAPDEKSLAQGKMLFVAGCLPCHGATGKGDGPAAATLERNGVRVHPGNLADAKMWQQTDGAIFWKLTEGKTPMPAWRETLSEEQRWSVIHYIRTLAPKPTSNPAVTNKLATAQPQNKP
jgi:mono/diheme cytochrome c family protein